MSTPRRNGSLVPNSRLVLMVGFGGLLLLMAFSVLATLLALYWKNFAYSSSAIRRRLMPGERYAGRYLSIGWWTNVPMAPRPFA